MDAIKVKNLPCTESVAIVIFGITGDLSHRKLIPALYENAKSNHLPQPFYIIGFARRPWDDQKMREVLSQAIRDFARTQPVDEKVLNQLVERTHYIESAFQDRAGYTQLSKLLSDLGIKNTLFYLATPPSEYADIVEKIGQSDLEFCPGGWRRIVVEKPFGHDLKSAQLLDESLHAVFHENQIYRMDHYLGKETVQNILAFRFGNGIFEPLWNRNILITSKSLWQNRKAWEPGQDITTVQVWSEMCSRITYYSYYLSQPWKRQQYSAPKRLEMKRSKY